MATNLRLYFQSTSATQFAEYKILFFKSRFIIYLEEFDNNLIKTGISKNGLAQVGKHTARLGFMRKERL